MIFPFKFGFENHLLRKPLVYESSILCNHFPITGIYLWREPAEKSALYRIEQKAIHKFIFP
jgi:hypothetical protein